MKLKKVAALCNAEGRYFLMDQKDDNGKIVSQRLGDGNAFYPLAGLPVMNMENICTMFDIPEKKLEKLLMRQIDATDTMNWEDTDPLEREIDDPKLCVRYAGADLLPLETSEGVTFIQEKYLLPLENLEYMRLYERKGRNGVYVVAKIGLEIQALIMPMDLPDPDFMGLLANLTRQCREAMRYRALVPRQEDVPAREPLFWTDESTGEVVGEGEENG